MATYQRKIGQNDVFETSDPNNPRYVSFDEANKNNIWGSVQNIPRQENYGLGSTPKPAPYQDFMKTWLEGYGKKQSMLTGVQKQISDVENLLGSLEKDIKSRTQDYLVTQAQRNRQIASEGAPLREQYAGLLKGQSAVESSLAGEREMLPYMKEFLEYESPAEKAKRTYAESMKEYEDKLKLERQYKTPEKPTTTSDITEYEYAKNNGYKGTFEQWTAKKMTPTGPTTDVKMYLKNQGIPVSVATSKGTLNTSARNKVIENGVSEELIDFFWENMQAGNDFETIRDGMRKQGMDTAWLDNFVQALQS